MKFTRSDYFGEQSEIIDSYKKNLVNNSNTVNVQELIANRFYNPKTAVEEYLDEFRDRAGLKNYLKQINAELESNIKIAQDEPESLIDIPEIKESIDKALNSKVFDRTVDFLNKLQDAVSNDIRVPEDLKGVSMDAKLIDYIKTKIQNDEEDVDYGSALKPRSDSDVNSDQRDTSYFNFESKEENGQY